MDFSMGLTPGITGKAQPRSRFGDNNFRLLQEGKAYAAIGTRTN
jgi:hypothetical protein